MLLYTVDQAFLPIACVSIGSVVSHCNGECPPVTVLLHEVDMASKTSAAAYLERLGVEYHFVDVPTDWCQPWASARGQSPAKFGYLRMDHLIPKLASRVIVIDADTRFVDDINKLLDVPLGGHVLGAVHDTGVIANGRVATLCSKLNVPEAAGYFNSGLLVIDLERWRRNKIGEAAISVFTDRPEILTFNDQCALNAVLAGEYQELPMRWNHIHGASPVDWPVSLYHYAGHFKPWEFKMLKRSFSLLKNLLGPSHIVFYRDAIRGLNWHSDRPVRVEFSKTVNEAGLLTKMLVQGKIRAIKQRSSSETLRKFAMQNPHLM